MKSNVLEYKGYHTKVEYIAENNILYGKIEGINDLVTFEASDLSSVEKEFHEAVDDYLAFCEAIGQPPEKEYKGKLGDASSIVECLHLYEKMRELASRVSSYFELDLSTDFSDSEKVSSANKADSLLVHRYRCAEA